jgi:hypothetical protein
VETSNVWTRATRGIARRARFRLLLCAISLGSASVQAQPARSAPAARPPDSVNAVAALRWDEGVAAFDSGNFEAARLAFQQAYAVKQDPEVLRNLGVSEVLSGHHLDGARHLSEYLAVASRASDSERRDLEAMLARAEERVGRVAIEVTPAGAQIFLDGARVGDAPLARPVHVEPGEHVIQVSQQGLGTDERRIQIAAGESQEIALVLQAPAADAAGKALPAEQTPEPPPSNRRPSVFPVVVGSTLVAAGIAAGVGFSVAAGNDADEAERLRGDLGSDDCSVTSGNGTCQALQDVAEREDTHRNIATASFITAGVAALATAAYWFWPRKRHAAQHTPELDVRVGLRESTILVTGSF